MSKPTNKQRRRADAVQRAILAWNARVAGATWDQAGEMAGFQDATAAHRAVKREFGRLPQPSTDEVRQLLDARHEVLWRQNQKDMRDGKPGAIRAGVAVLRSHSQLLGADAPSKLEVYRPDADEFVHIVTAMKEKMLEGLPREGDIFEVEVEVVDE